MSASELSTRSKPLLQPESNKRPLSRGRDAEGRSTLQIANRGKKDRTRESTPKSGLRRVSAPAIAGTTPITGPADGASSGLKNESYEPVVPSPDGWKDVSKRRRAGRRRESQNRVLHYDGPVLQPAAKTKPSLPIRLAREISNPLPFSYAQVASLSGLGQTRTTIQTSPSWAVQRHPAPSAPLAPAPVIPLSPLSIVKAESSVDDSDTPCSIFDEEDSKSDRHSDTDLSLSSIGDLGLPPGIEPDECLLNPKRYFQELEDLEREVVSNSGLFLMSQENRRAYPTGSEFILKFKFESFTPQGAAAGLPSYDQRIMSCFLKPANAAPVEHVMSMVDPKYWAFHILECRNLLLAVVSNIDRLRRANYCAESINVIVLDSSRRNVAKLIGIEIGQIMRLHQSFEQAIERIQSLLHLLRIQQSELKELTQELSAQSDHLLIQLGLPLGNSTVGGWRKAVLVLDLAITSYCGAHLERFDERFLSESLDYAKITSAWSYDTLCQEGIMIRRRSLRCLRNFLRAQEVWVLQSQNQWNDVAELYLSTSIEEFADVWGPTWAVRFPERQDQVVKYNAGTGAIVPWPVSAGCPPLADGEEFCHWTLPEEAEGKASAFLSQGARLLIGAATIIEQKTSQLKDNQACKNKPQQVLQQLRSSNLVEELGTRKAYSYLAEETVSACVGAYGMAIGGSKVYKRRSGVSHKESIFTAWKNSTGERHPAILEQWLGVEVSFCTRNARRRRLKSILNSTTMRNWLEACETDCEALPCHRAFLEALDSRDPRAFRDLYLKHQEWRKDLTRLVACCLEGLLHSSIDEEGTLRTLWIPQPEKRVRVKLKQYQHSWTSFLTDSEDTCFFAVMSGKCLQTDYRDISSCQCRFTQSSGSANTVLETALVINEEAPKPKDLRYRPAESEKNKQGRWSISRLRRGDKLPLASGRLRVIEPFARTRLLVEWEIGVLKKWNDAKLQLSKSVGKETLYHWELKDHDDWPTKPIPLFILSNFDQSR